MSSRKSGYSFKCVVKSCGEIKTQKESISFFSFPIDPTRCEIWLERCELSADILSQKNIKICGKHFEKNMFLNFLEIRLKPDAIPTLFPDKKDGCDVSTSLELSSSDKVGICSTLTKSVSCGSNSLLKMFDDTGKYTTETYRSNEVLAFPLPGSPGVHNSVHNSFSSGTSSSFTSEKSRCLDSPLDFISPSCQTLKAWSEKHPEKFC